MAKKEKPSYNGLEFDSVGEMHFYWWLEELKDNGYVSNIELQPTPFPLSEKVSMSFTKHLKTKSQVKQFTVMREHIYTADVLFWFTGKADGIFHVGFNTESPDHTKQELSSLKTYKDLGYCYVELKPSFDQNNMTRLAVLNQKWVMEKYGKFINIVIPEKLFEKTFTPIRYLSCDKSKKARKIKYDNVITLNEYLKNHEEKRREIPKV